MAQLVYRERLLFESGDRLTRKEFIARWECMPALKKAELIDGVVYVPSPVSIGHSYADGVIQRWAGTYANRANRVDLFPNATWFMEEESAPQPDLCLRLRPSPARGWDPNEYLSGAADFIAEITKSTRSYDLGPKLRLYERAGVREYLAVLMEDQRMEWRVLREGRFELMQADSAGILRSAVFPGLWLDQAAFWRDDIPGVLAALERGLQSPEFEAFVAKHPRTPEK